MDQPPDPVVVARRGGTASHEVPQMLEADNESVVSSGESVRPATRSRSPALVPERNSGESTYRSRSRFRSRLDLDR